MDINRTQNVIMGLNYLDIKLAQLIDMCMNPNSKFVENTLLTLFSYLNKRNITHVSYAMFSLSFKMKILIYFLMTKYHS